MSRRPRSADTALTAESICEIANDVLPPDPTSTVDRPSVVDSAGVSDTFKVSTFAVELMPTWNITELAEPSSSLTPLNWVVLAIRLMLLRIEST